VTIAVWLIVALFGCLIAVGVYGFLQYDKLVEFANAEYPNDWQRDGRPDGFFCRYTDGNQWQRGSVLMRWVFSTPDWIKLHDEAASWLRRLRVCILIWYVGMLLLLVLLNLILKR
jgi:hypothetical protein